MEEIGNKKIRHYKIEIFPVITKDQPRPDTNEYVMRKIHCTDDQSPSEEYTNAHNFDDDYAIRINIINDKTYLFFCDGTKTEIEAVGYRYILPLTIPLINLISRGICLTNNKFYNSTFLTDTNVYAYVKNNFTYAIILTRIRKHDIWEDKESNKVLDLRISVDFSHAADIIYLNSVKKAIADYLHKENEVKEKQRQEWREADRARENWKKNDEYWKKRESLYKSSESGCHYYVENNTCDSEELWKELKELLKNLF